MLAVQMSPDLVRHAFSTTTSVSSPDSCTTQTIGPAAGTILGLSLMALPPQEHTDPNRPAGERPKLSLSTSMLPLPFGKSTTGLTLSVTADSPTRRNSYANAYDSHRSSTTNSPSSSTKPKSPTRRVTSPYPYEAPYQLALGIRSILRNGPLPRRHLSTTSARTPRRMFPDTKRVTYKSPLEEVVPAKRTSSEFGDDSENEIPADDSGGEEETGNASDDHASVPTLQTKNDDERKIPATFAGRHRKRQRQWVWTLGELESTDLVEPDRRDPS